MDNKVKESLTMQLEKERANRTTIITTGAGMAERGTQSAARNRSGSQSPEPTNRENATYRETI
jgi:hypothetical protein